MDKYDLFSINGKKQISDIIDANSEELENYLIASDSNKSLNDLRFMIQAFNDLTLPDITILFSAVLHIFNRDMKQYKEDNSKEIKEEDYNVSADIKHEI